MHLGTPTQGIEHCALRERRALPSFIQEARVPQVYNKRDRGHPPATYVGRPTKWGNPFQIGPDGNRAQVIEKYKVWLQQSPALLIAAKQELVGKNLECWCAPLPCHADILLKIANT